MHWLKTNSRKWYMVALLFIAVAMIPTFIGLNDYHNSTRTYTGEVIVEQRDHRPDRHGMWVQGRTDTPQNDPDLYRVRLCPTDPDYDHRCWWKEVPRSIYEVAHEGARIESHEGTPSLPEGSRP